MAFAIATPFSTFSKRLLNKTCIFTAEMSAISTALKYIRGRNNDRRVIFSDSALHQEVERHILTTALDILSSIHAESKNVIFHWVPSHVRIPRNDQMDSAATLL